VFLLSGLNPKTGHNGGNMMWGPEGYLYIGFGEGMFAQKKMWEKLDGSIVGSILRIDVRKRDPGLEYAIPKDNPFVGDPKVRDEVWARGFRNPWRWSFVDKDTIIVGDVGQSTHEEINITKKGMHQGWPYVEGGRCSMYLGKCDMNKYNRPLTYFSRAVSRSITGGYVYRGSKIERFKGKYIFADYLRGIMSVDYPNAPKFVEQMWSSGFTMEFPKIPMPFGPEKGRTILPVSFYEDENKELIVVAINGGIFRLKEIDFITAVKGFFYMFGSFR
jgi:hypothetical protein